MLGGMSSHLGELERRMDRSVEELTASSSAWIGSASARALSRRKCCPYLDKMGWIATPASCSGAAQIVDVIKRLSAECLTANMPIDFYLGACMIDAEYKPKYQIILDVLQRRVVIDITAEDDNDGATSAAAQDGTQPEAA